MEILIQEGGKGREDDEQEKTKDDNRNEFDVLDQLLSEDNKALS